MDDRWALIDSPWTRGRTDPYNFLNFSNHSLETERFNCFTSNICLLAFACVTSSSKTNRGSLICFSSLVCVQIHQYFVLLSIVVEEVRSFIYVFFDVLGCFTACCAAWVDVRLWSESRFVLVGGVFFSILSNSVLGHVLLNFEYVFVGLSRSTTICEAWDTVCFAAWCWKWIAEVWSFGSYRGSIRFSALSFVPPRV